MDGGEEAVECDAAVVQRKDEAQLDEEGEYMRSLSASLIIQTPLQVARLHTGQYFSASVHAGIAGDDPEASTKTGRNDRGIESQSAALCFLVWPVSIVVPVFQRFSHRR